MPEVRVEKAAPKAVPEVVAEKPKNPAIERWWSNIDPEHRIVISYDNLPVLVKFVNYSYVCDLDTDEGRKVSKGLHECGREGRDIFVIGSIYGDSEIGGRVDMMKSLREIAEGFDGANKIKGLFSWKELVESGVNPHSTDVDELIMLALRMKKFNSEVRK